MPIAITEEQRAVQESIRAAGSTTTSEVRALESEQVRNAQDSWRRSWSELADIGVFSITVPEELGGAGGSVVDLAAALEQAADVLVPGPVLPTAVAAVVLGRRAGAPIARELLPRLSEGRAAVAVAVEPGELVAVDQAGTWRLSGSVSPVLGAGDAEYLLLPARIEGQPDRSHEWFLLAAEHARTTERAGLDFSRSLGVVELREVEVTPDAVLPELRSHEVRDLLMTLGAAEASGVAAWCLRTAVEHARVREQFGRAIGSFQAVKHLCAEMLCRAEQAGALAWDAARALDERAGEHALVAAAAGAVVLDAAVETAKDCIQVLGGTGFTWEHDAHLYLRRAVALRQLLGGSAAWRRRAAEHALAGARRSLGIGRLPTEVERKRPTVRAEVEKIAALPPEQQRIRLADSGYLAPHWPAPYGRDASPPEQLLMDEELRKAGVTRPDLVIGGWAAPTILEHGSPEQQERFVLPTLRGEITWCQLFSEPGAGSDLASLRTRAQRETGGWRLHGQKVWTSLAQEADWAICLARTDPDAPKHRGITYFLVDMRSAGIDVRPLREITGEAVFNEVFLDGVFVPDECVVGAVHGGWKLARTTLANERVAMSGGSSLGREVERVLEVVQRRGIADDLGVRERIGSLVAEGLSVSLLGLRATLRRLDGQDPGPVSSVEKLVGVRHRQTVAEATLDLLGADAVMLDGDAADAAHEFLLSRCLSIAGGTTQVLRTLAGERILGLPREAAK